ncbi:MAG: hypothetical protein HYY62_06490 [Deltaproteobacteria bacterium]|nr:hypothetical protein [Deltaproteobacteria bacterium]
MKKNLAGLTTFLFVLFSISTLWAEPTPWLTGPFKINPGGMHPNGISGKMTLLFEGKDFTSVQLDLDKAVVGKTRYLSVEQALFEIPKESGSQVALAYKLGGPPHKWYFVVVVNSTPTIAIQTAYSGTLCKVPAGSLAEVSEKIKNGIDTIPSDWKVVGSITLASQLF